MSSKLSDQIGQFVTIPFSFIEQSSQLSHIAFRLFILLRYYTNGKTGDSFPTYDLIQENTGMKRRTIAKAIRELEAAGWIERKRRFGSSTIYTIKIPAPISAQMDTTISAQKDTIISTPIGTISRLNEQERSNKIEFSADAPQPDEPPLNHRPVKESESEKPKPPAPEHNSKVHKCSPNYKLLFGAIAKFTKTDPVLSATSIGKAAREFDQIGATPADIEAVCKWWYANDWRGKKNQAPTLYQLKECWQRAKDAVNGETPTVQAEPTGYKAIREYVMDQMPQGA